MRRLVLSLSTYWNRLLNSSYLLRQNTETHPSVIYYSFPSLAFLRCVTTETWRNYPSVLCEYADLLRNIPVHHSFIHFQTFHVQSSKWVKHQHYKNTMWRHKPAFRLLLSILFGVKSLENKSSCCHFWLLKSPEALLTGPFIDPRWETLEMSLLHTDLPL